MNVRRRYGKRQQDDQIACKLPVTWPQQHERKHNLQHPADVHELQMPGQVRRHDRNEEGWIGEVRDAAHEEPGKDDGEAEVGSNLFHAGMLDRTRGRR